MLAQDSSPPKSGAGMPATARPGDAGLVPLAAADLQDHLLVARNDLDRLQRLLGDAGNSLLVHFHAASGELRALLQQHAHAAVEPRATALPAEAPQLHRAMEHMAAAITAMQFQDVASQLVAHTTRRLRHCADRLAAQTMGDDDEDGRAVVEALPLCPNPVTQDEMDAGSVELF
ncbi:MAG: hypothetical protein ACKO3M_15025 [Rubrivivax sp.]